MIPFGACHLRQTLSEFVTHYHRERTIRVSGTNSSTACGPRGMPAGFAVVSVWANCSTIIAARRDGSRVAGALGRIVGHYGSETYPQVIDALAFRSHAIRSPRNDPPDRR